MSQPRSTGERRWARLGAAEQSFGSKKRLVAGPIVLLLLGLSLPALAGGFHISILGVRRTGMMTNLGNPDDVTALFHNPAGLADQPGTRLHLSNGITFLNNQTRLQALDPERFPEVNPAGCGTGDAAPCPWPIAADGYYTANFEPERYTGVIPFLGGSWGLQPLSPKLRGVTVALAAYAPGAYGAYLPEDAPTAYFVVDGLFLIAQATAGVGWRLDEHFAIGGSLSYSYLRLGYSQKFSMADVLTPAGEAVGLGKIGQLLIGDLQMAYVGTDSGFGWGLGALVTPAPWLSLGVGATGFTAARFEGDLEIRGLGTATGEYPPARSDAELRALLVELGKGGDALSFKLPRQLEVEMPIPPALTAGLSFRPTPALELGLDLRYWLYRGFEEQEIEPVYDPTEPGQEPLTRDGLSHDKDYSDSFEVAAGVLYRPLADPAQLELMAGVAFDKSPVPAATFSIDNPSMNQVILSCGIRGLLREHWRLGLAYMWIHYLERDVTTSSSSPPTNVRISGNSHIPTLELEYLF